MIDWVYSVTVEKLASTINGNIKVTKFRGRISVWVGGFEQSGSIYVEKLWKNGLAKVKSVPKKILVLGLGCGTIVKLVAQKWPGAKIVGVEVDPVMISLGKKYFNLTGYKNLKIVQADAKKQKLSGYDLIICDAYLGGKNQLPKLHFKTPILQNILNPKTLKNEIILSSKK